MSKYLEQLENTNLYKEIADLIVSARRQVANTANISLVHTYFEIGRMIVENEQSGKLRAEYGKKVLIELSNKLCASFGKGFSVENLNKMRYFYKIYSSSISSTSSTKLLNSLESRANDSIDNNSFEFESLKYESPFRNFTLSWSHYLILMRIKNPEERKFYEIEAFQQQWSEKQLKRQYNSSLYERLALSRNKEDLIKLGNVGQAIEKPEDLLKNPITLEFLGLEAQSTFTETDLENSIIGKLQHFLLELGKGFLFEARQKRFTFDEEHYFVDLVFYNRLLQCYVLIDLKTDKLAHQDLGQMQIYVNYYDRFVKLEHEKPTIGILLCKEKKDALVELTLPKDANIYASEYSLYLPDKKLLQEKLEEWSAEFEIIIKR